MNVLLDTHTFLWFVHDDPRLSRPAERVIASPRNTLHLSTVSLWEIAVKVSIGKLDLGRSFTEFIDQFVAGRGLRLIGIELAHLERYVDLPLHHRDPFDRLLISQAQTEGWPVVTADPRFRDYGVRVKW